MWANVGVAATPRSRMAVVVVDSILFELKDAVDCGRWEEGGRGEQRRRSLEKQNWNS